MVAIVTAADLDPATLAVIGGKLVANDPTKAPLVIAGLNTSSSAEVVNGDSVVTAIGKLQAQVVGGGGGGGSFDSYHNADIVTMVAGSPVYLVSEGNTNLAIGNTAGRKVIGLYAGPDPLPVAGSGLFLTKGSLTLSAAQWQVVTGTAGGLTPGSRYFLDINVPGLLQPPPTASGAPTGSFMVPVGYALSSTEFLLDVQPSVRIA